MKKIRQILAIPELKSRVVFTLVLLCLCRLGAFVPVPGIDGEMAVKLFQQATGGVQNLFQLVDVFSGGAFAHMTVVALGVMPYITASIVMQILMIAIPSLYREVKENHEAGRRKLSKWTRLLTVVIAVFQSATFAKVALHMDQGVNGIIVPGLISDTLFGFPILYYLIFISTMTTGSILLMWLGEQITEKGIGNGMSLIIALGILSSLPSSIGSVIRSLNLDSQEAGQLTVAHILLLASLFTFVIMGTILVIQGQRRIPVEYARKNTSAASTPSYIPLKINYAGVIPVIFAGSVLMFPATIGQFLGIEGWLGSAVKFLAPGSYGYMALYALLILFFTYFWTSTQFHPEQIASDMKKTGAFIPGVRQGQPTKEFLESTMNRITFVGAIFLAVIALLPTLVAHVLRVDNMVSHFFGGTSLLILVGVVLDTAKQIESHLITNKYDGLLLRGRIVGR